MTVDKPLSLSASRMTGDVRKAVDAALAKHKLQNLKVGDGMAISSGIVASAEVMVDVDILGLPWVRSTDVLQFRSWPRRPVSWAKLRPSWSRR